MRFVDLKTYVDVVEAGGMTQAATAQGVSQPGISRIIRELEASVGTPLLRRTGRGVELTPAGTLFLSFARDSLAASERMVRDIRSLAGTLPETLTIAFPRRVGTFFVAEVYRRFLKEFPDVTLVTQEALSEEIAQGLASGRIDVAVTYLADTPGTGSAKTIYQEKLYLAGRPGPLFETADPISLQDVASEDILLNSSANLYRRLIDQAAAAAGISLNVIREIESAEALLAFAIEAQGLTILPYSNMVAEAARGEIMARQIQSPEIDRKIYLHAGRHLDRQSAERVFQTLQRCFSDKADQLRWTRLEGR